MTRYTKGFPGGSVAKNLPAMQEPQETQVQSLGWEDPLEKGMEPTPVFLPGESHGQRGLVGCSPWGHKELDMTEATWNACMLKSVIYLLRKK